MGVSDHSWVIDMMHVIDSLTITPGAPRDPLGDKFFPALRRVYWGAHQNHHPYSPGRKAFS